MEQLVDNGNMAENTVRLTDLTVNLKCLYNYEVLLQHQLLFASFASLHLPGEGFAKLNVCGGSFALEKS